MTRGVLLSAALAAMLLLAPDASAQTSSCTVPSDSACVGLGKVTERAAAECRRAMYAGIADPDSCPALPLARRVSQQAIAEYESSWLHRTLAFQHDLAGDVPFVDAPWLSTHNSFNDPNELPTVSHTDSNQQLGLRDQLRIDMRSLELDVHWLPSPRAAGPAPVVCHGQGQYIGCTTERLLSERLPEIVDWLDENPAQVLLLYIQDEIYEAAGYEATIDVLSSQLGAERIYRPSGTGCRNLPLDLTRREVLDAGAQVVIVSSCQDGPSLAPVAFAWPDEVRFEERPHDFGAAGCQNAGKDVPYATRLVRMYEDSTWLATTPASSEDDGMTPETVTKMLRCGVDMLGFDQLLPDDGRLAAAAWSWADGEPRRGDCAQMGAGGRWESVKCSKARPVACRAADGRWSVLKARRKSKRIGSQCEAAGLQFAAPRTGLENEQLKAAAGGRAVLLGLRRSGGRFAALDAR